MAISSHPADTLGFMKDEIADELARPDLTDQIAAKIGEAIECYQQERFFFSETRDITFNTVAGREFYTASDNAAIPNLQAFDYLLVYLGSIPWPLARRTDVEMEVLNQNGLVRGQPWNWSYYNQQLRLGPIPDSTLSIRVAAQNRVTPPASDDELNNPWMTGTAKLLIRARTKYELFLHVIKNLEMAQAMVAAVADAESSLKGQTNRLTGRGLVAPMEF